MVDLNILNCDLFGLADQTFDSFPEVSSIEDFGSYRILHLIGRGGAGEVFLAEDQLAQRQIAIKFLRNFCADPARERYFARESRTLAQLEHPLSPGCMKSAFIRTGLRFSRWSTLKVSR